MAGDRKSSDEVIRSVGSAVAQGWPAGLETPAVYVVGSYARAAAGSESDLDLVVIGSDSTDSIRRTMKEIYLNCQGSVPALDLTVFNATELRMAPLSDRERIARRESLFPLVDHGRHVAGPHFRSDILLRLDSLGAAETSRMPWVFSRRLRGETEVLAPVDIDDPPSRSDEYLGYLASGSTKLVVTLASWIGAGIVAIRSQDEHIASRNQAVRRLRSVEPSLANWLAEMIARCKKSWRYRLPTSEDDRRELRLICARVHELEMYFAAEYQSLEPKSL